ncbi:hypothetical protein [Dongia sp.]|uniref:hypothetical protein n=1 Tax=Dongia sp. TaxID=1977262 RepID=UPI0035AF02F8
MSKIKTRRIKSGAKTYALDLPPGMLSRGFWLYVWRVKVDRKSLLYVGRTGDNSSPFAVSPYQRLGQHLSKLKSQNALKRHLAKLGHEPENCSSFEFICHGPIYPEITTGCMDDHVPVRNAIGALEKGLAQALRKAGYTVMNEVRWTHSHDKAALKKVVNAFRYHFPKIMKP